jgi:hypothetical protein
MCVNRLFNILSEFLLFSSCRFAIHTDSRGIKPVMRTGLRLFCALTLFLFAFSGSVLKAGKQASPATQVPAPGPVLVELFTSEGCSSCPPADAVLAQLDEMGNVGGAEVIVLEEHVDYWDHQGWKDPFSSYQWTERQQDYAGVFHEDGVYTPQMVVDGWEQLVGSREYQAIEAIKQAEQKPKAVIHLVVQQQAPSRYILNMTVQLPPADEKDDGEVWLAVTEKDLAVHVLRGENAGDDLHHSEVVRMMRKIGNTKRNKQPTYTGVQIVQLKPEWKPQNLRFVVFIQDKKSLHILGAAAIRPL